MTVLTLFAVLFVWVLFGAEGTWDVLFNLAGIVCGLSAGARILQSDGAR